MELTRRFAHEAVVQPIPLALADKNAHPTDENTRDATDRGADSQNKKHGICIAMPKMPDDKWIIIIDDDFRAGQQNGGGAEPDRPYAKSAAVALRLGSQIVVVLEVRSQTGIIEHVHDRFEDVAEFLAVPVTGQEIVVENGLIQLVVFETGIGCHLKLRALS